MKKNISLLLIAIVLLSVSACKKNDNTINLFTLNQDKEFGAQLKVEIENNPTEYPLLDEAQYPEAYTHIKRIRDAVLASDDLNHRDDFTWEVKIINSDVLNAFAAPGGYIYFYTGLIKFLDDEAQLAGVMAHEIAHADRRHSTDNLTKQYGFSVMLSVLLGKDPSTLTQIVQSLSSLRFSRKSEIEADEYAVRYTADTDYFPKGIVGFFEKMEGNAQPPEFMSTHPSHENRIENIDNIWKDLGSKSGELFVDRYNDFKASLP